MGTDGFDNMCRGTPDGTRNVFVVMDTAVRLSAVLLTHDISTLIPLLATRMNAEVETPRVILVAKETSPAIAAADILIVLGAGTDNDWDGGVIFVPL